MKTRNLIVICVLAAALVLSLVSCGGEKKAEGIDLDKAVADITALGVFPDGEQPSEEVLRDVMMIDPALVEDSRIHYPTMIVHSSTYWIVLAKEGEEAALKQQIDAHMAVQEESWSMYLPDQYDIIAAREYREYETEKGTYLVYVASTDNEAVLAAIEGALV